MFFKPAGVPARELEQIFVQVDEIEALRLTDLLGLSQEQAAERLGVSRQTVGRVLEEARSKVADALVNGKALIIQGGAYHVVQSRCCDRCGHRWMTAPAAGEQGEAAVRTAEEERCPACGSMVVTVCPHPQCADGPGQDRPGGGRERAAGCGGRRRGGAGRCRPPREPDGSSTGQSATKERGEP